jgi:2-hydroxy-3-keto-5-methylthiopentenyl-1-phosphate phosphatase
MSQTTDKPTTPAKVLVQCDFDGTITVEDVSFIILDTFARGDWHKLDDAYEAGKMTVGRFNREAVAMMRTTKKAAMASIKGKYHVRAGFAEFAKYCRNKGYRLVIVSNGFDCYIEKILQELGLSDIEFHAANLRFSSGRVSTKYLGPDGREEDNSLKEAFVDHFLNQGYRIIYIGDGASDFKPARKCQRIFARETLLQKCEAAGVSNTGYGDFFQIMKKLEARK